MSIKPNHSLFVPDNGHGITCCEMPRPTITELMRWEDGMMDAEQELDLFTRLVTTGMIHHLQGMYGRQAHALGLL